MKSYTWALFIVLNLVGTNQGFAQDKNDAIKLSSDPYCPFVCDAVGGQGAGVDLVLEALAAEKIPAEFEILPWQRVLDGVRRGTINAVVGAVKADDRPFIWVEEPIGKIQDFFFRKKGSSWVYSGIESLQQVQLGGTEGYQYDKPILDFVNQNKGGRVELIAAENALKLNLKKLLAGRVDILIDEVNVVRYAIKTEQLSDKVEPASPAGPEEYLWVGFSPALANSAVLAEKTAHGIKKLRQDGRLAAILDRYGLIDWKTAH